MYRNKVFGTAKSVLFIEVSSFQGVLNMGLHCSQGWSYMYVTQAIRDHNDGLFVTCLCFYSDERHPRPGKKSKTDDDDRSDEEDLNEANYDEVRVNPSN